MKIIINQAGVKKVIEGPFEICLSGPCIVTLLKCIAAKSGIDLVIPEKGPSFNYGWIKIFDEPRIEARSNPEP